MAATTALGHDPRNNFVGSNPRNSMSIQNSKGLLNMPGQNNCFLNSAVQVLWHLDIFRRSFRDISGHACMAESCIFCALKELFAQFQYSNESALPPDALRRALAETFFNQQRFQLGHMDDAAECFENILTRIHFHIANTESEDMCNAAHCIPHQKFAMTLVEQSICHSCGATSEPLTYTQMVHYVSASALCAQSSIMEREGKSDVNMFGHLLRKAGGMGDFRDCPSSCGAKIQICRTLMNRPDIVSVGVVWDSDHPPLDHILDVFRAIGTSMQLQNVFHSVVDKRWGSSTYHQLVGVVTYYGKHYSTFFFHTKLKVWIYFDDATVREIGPRWEQVIEKCCRGHFQPLLLLYASPNGSPITMDGAPQTVTMVPAQKNSATQAMKPKNANKFLGIRRSVSPMIDHAGQNAISEARQRRSVTPSMDMEHQKYAANESIKPHRTVMRQQSVDDLLNSANTNPDNFNTYISRKAVENILSQQKLHWQQQSPNSKLSYNSSVAGNRNSNSSLESFENALKMRLHGNEMRLDIPDGANVPRRRDSGNWSGDRNSASSASSTSQENPYFFLVGKSKSPSKVPTSPKRGGPDFPNILSDAGYDSFSLSSTDSFPSITSQGKYDLKLCQIPENPLSLISTDHFPPQGFADDCDRLCFEADQLLLLSQEKENEGDLAMALTLSDCAASKARTAMDAPYNNSKSIMAAKMKHSTCVMRSCSLHRRLAQETKETKATEGRHSRQSSRDSTKSNKSSKDKSQKETIDKQNKNSIDIYGTLPKKHSRRRCNSSGSSSEMKAAALRANKEICDIPNPTQEIYVKSEGKRTVREVKQEHKHKKLSREDGMKYKEHKKQLLDGYLSVDAADYSDYYSEWDEGKKPGLIRSYSGSQTIKDPSSIKCKDDLNQSCNIPANKKQHKVRRKLLMGGLIRRKNRSMPDLTDTNDEAFNDFKENNVTKKDVNVDNFHSEVNSVIHSRGFLQPHPAFMRNNGKLPQHNRLPPPPPVRIPANKMKFDQQTTQKESKKSVKRVSNSPQLTTFSPEYHSSSSPLQEIDRPKSPVVHYKDYPEYMNLQNIQMKINNDSVPQNIQKGNNDKHLPVIERSSSTSPTLFYSNSSPSIQTLPHGSTCQKVNNTSSSHSSNMPQYMNTMDYMSLCKSVNNHNCEPSNAYNIPTLPEYMNLQYLRDVQNDVDNKSGPGSLPLPPPPSPQSIAPSVADLPLPPPPEQLLEASHDEPDGTAANRPSPFLLELKAKKEELEKKALEKSDSEITKETNTNTNTKKSNWLEELQVKQMKMLQKKTTEQKNTGAAAENSSDKTLNLVTSNETVPMMKNIKMKPKMDSPIFLQNDNSSNSNTSTGKDNSVRSVKDLASRFEQIMKIPEPQVTESATELKNNDDKKSVIQNLDERIKNLKSPAMKRKADNLRNENNVPAAVIKNVETVVSGSAVQSVPNIVKNIIKESPPTIMSYTDMTEAELAEIAKCTDKNTQSNALMTENSPSLCKNDLNNSFSRPMLPPDYETAIKRIGQREINNNSLERKENAQKKKRPGRKSVTFSDQVVLVACANDNQEEYMPHPLLEKAFRQHTAEKSDKSDSAETHNSSVEVKTNVCDLCHDQPVVNAELYCSNCSFYMSRFRPKC